MQDQPTNNQPTPTQPPKTAPVSATEPTPDGSLTFLLSIRNRRAVIFEEAVKALTSLNDKGTFDVLPHHGNFISLLKDYIIIYKKDGTKQTIPIVNGVLYVRKNEAYCYIDLLSPEVKPSVGAIPAKPQA